MATSTENAIAKALEFLNSKRNITALKEEQKEAVASLLGGEDVLAVLPTGFGKSLIFTTFALAEKARSEGKNSVTVLVISPLKSITIDQISELEGICTAVELNPDSLNDIVDEPPEFIYAAAENALDKDFLKCLRDSKTKLHQRLSLIVVDESHTVQTWSGRR